MSIVSLTIRPDGNKSFKATENTVLPSVFVITMPKSGTYLLAKILEEAGFSDTEIHVGIDSVSDYRDLQIEEKIKNAISLQRACPIEETCSLIRSGQFAVGHLPLNERTTQSLSGFRKILSKREPRSALVSAMRFEERRCLANPLWHENRREWVLASTLKQKLLEFLRIMGRSYIQDMFNIVPWLEALPENVFEFESLSGLRGAREQRRQIERVFEIISVSRVDHERVMERALWAKTLTYSGSMTNVDDYWSSEAELAFQELGGKELEKKLGY